MELTKHREIQNIAKEVLGELTEHINSSSTERSIADTATQLMTKKGIEDTWYHGVPAFVLLWSRSCLSISGKDYSPANEPVGETNLVTVDLSPRHDHLWGDCARSFCIENGTVSSTPNDKGFSHGLDAQRELHQSMTGFVTTQTTFSELFEFGNKLISNLGYENLDFLSNLGHSIEVQLEDRKFIDENCSDLLCESKFFTFEPHIRKKDEVWGFKHENIYYFNRVGKVIEL